MRLICYDYVNNAVYILLEGKIIRYGITLCSYFLLNLGINDDENMFKCKYPKICSIDIASKKWHSDLILEPQLNCDLMREI